MKYLIKSALVVATLATSAYIGTAAASITDSQYLAQCKESVQAQYASVSDIDVANMKSRRNAFKAKLRITVDGQRSVVKCEIRDNEPVALVCLKGNACEAESVATK